MVIRWRGLERRSDERFVFRHLPAGYRAEGIHIDSEYALTYRVEIDRSWQFRSLDLAMFGEDRGLALRRDADGTWTDGPGNALPFLNEAREIDLSFSPFTNTLPIRRLNPLVGEAFDIVMAYVDLPSLAVTADPQRYTRLHDHAFRFESLDSGFRRDIEIDSEGFVVEYPGLFTREEIR